MGEIDATRVREVLDYDFETGRFTWRVKRTRVTVGDLAGCLDAGRYKIRISGRNYWAHRLAFLWMTGEWPQGEVDHKNGNPTDNRWSNLRDATRPQNQHNRGVRK